jgi:hypothetical protein
MISPEKQKRKNSKYESSKGMQKAERASKNEECRI